MTTVNMIRRTSESCPVNNPSHHTVYPTRHEYDYNESTIQPHIIDSANIICFWWARVDHCINQEKQQYSTQWPHADRLLWGGWHDPIYKVHARQYMNAHRCCDTIWQWYVEFARQVNFKPRIQWYDHCVADKYRNCHCAQARYKCTHHRLP